LKRERKTMSKDNWLSSKLRNKSNRQFGERKRSKRLRSRLMGGFRSTLTKRRPRFSPVNTRLLDKVLSIIEKIQ